MLKLEQAEVTVPIVPSQLVGRFNVDMDQFTRPESGHSRSHAIMNRCAVGSYVIACPLVDQDGFREVGTHDPLNVDVAA